MPSPLLPSMDRQLEAIRDASPNEYAFTHIDTCLPCYVQDHHNRDGELLLGVPVDGSNTIATILQGALDELREMAVEEGERGGFNYEKARLAIAAECTAIQTDGRGDELFSPSLEGPPLESAFETEEAFDVAHAKWESEMEMAESCYAWFLIHWNVPDDGEIVGFDPANGSILQYNADDGTTNNAQESPEKFGLGNISDDEIARLVRDGWTRPEIAA